MNYNDSPNNLMNYNVFNTEQEARDAQAYDFTIWKTVMTPIFNSPKYWEATTAWAEVKQRDSDDKWVYYVCPWGLQTHNQEVFDDSWFNGGSQ